MHKKNAYFTWTKSQILAAGQTGSCRLLGPLSLYTAMTGRQKQQLSADLLHVSVH